MLLQAVAEIGLQIVVCDDDGLAEQRTALGTAQVKHVAECGVVLQAQIVGGTRQAVGHPRAVHEQVESQLVAGGGNVGQFFLIIKGADLGGVRDVDHAGLDLVLVAGVGAVLLHGFADLAGCDLAVFAGQRQALVACGSMEPVSCTWMCPESAHSTPCHGLSAAAMTVRFAWVAPTKVYVASGASHSA